MGVVIECGGDGETGTDVVDVAASDQLAHDSSIANFEIMIRSSSLTHTGSQCLLPPISCLSSWIYIAVRPTALTPFTVVVGD
jgi:hypothetical protein